MVIQNKVNLLCDVYIYNHIVNVPCALLAWSAVPSLPLPPRPVRFHLHHVGPYHDGTRQAVHASARHGQVDARLRREGETRVQSGEETRNTCPFPFPFLLTPLFFPALLALSEVFLLPLNTQTPTQLRHHWA